MRLPRSGDTPPTGREPAKRNLCETGGRNRAIKQAAMTDEDQNAQRLLANSPEIPMIRPFLGEWRLYNSHSGPSDRGVGHGK